MKYTEVPGWFDFEDMYNNAIANSKDGDTLVELGSFLGKSTCYMMEKILESKKDLKFYCVDVFKITPDGRNGEDGAMPWNQSSNEWVKQNGEEALYEGFLKNVNSSIASSALTGHFREDSANAARHFENDSVNFVFIDASHRFENVLRDLENWYPKIKKGGMLAGHDYGHSGDSEVAQAVKFFCNKYNLKHDHNYSFWIHIDK